MIWVIRLSRSRVQPRTRVHAKDRLLSRQCKTEVSGAPSQDAVRANAKRCAEIRKTNNNKRETRDARNFISSPKQYVLRKEYLI